MKKYIYLLFFVSCLGSTIKAQVLWSEDFTSYTIGNLVPINDLYMGVGPDPNNYVLTPENWLLCSVPHTNSTAPQFQVTIETETGKGNVLKIQDIPVSNTALSMRNTMLFAVKEIPHLDTLWKNRTIGNDILKYECEFYVGHQIRSPLSLGIGLSRIENNVKINEISLNGYVSTLGFTYIASAQELFIDPSDTGLPAPPSIPLNPSTWTKIIIYVDYTTGYVYFEVPSVSSAYRSNNPLPTQHFKLFNVLDLNFKSDVASNNGNRAPNFAKFDNFKVSAVNMLPLSLKKLAATKFTIFPNPITDFVTITNNDNIDVKQIEVFDISGKNVKTQTFNNENEVQLSLTDLVSGTYLLHIKTNAGIAIEKVIKK